MRRRSGGQHGVDVAHDFFRRVGLGNEDAVVGYAPPLRLAPAGRDDDVHPRPALVRDAGEFEAIQSAGHVDVREEHENVVARFQSVEGLFCVCGLQNFKARVRKRFRARPADERIILDDQNGGP